MKNSILYIVGALALLGGGAILFLKNKKNKDKDKLALAELQTATVNTPKVELQVTPELDLKNLQDAKNIATRLKNLKAEKQSMTDKYGSLLSKPSFGVVRVIKQKIENLSKEIETLNFTLKGMGYTENNGEIVKI
jgi:LPXTG-motif cell wall-anchored protein